MIAKVYLNKSKDYLIDKDFLKYTLLFKYLKILKENNEPLYKSTNVQLAKSHIGN